jgi:hypothetical protein
MAFNARSGSFPLSVEEKAMQNCHAAIWIDHKHAEVIKFNRTEDSEQTIRHRDAPAHIHHKAGCMGSGHVYEDNSYLSSVVEGIRDAEQILIVGPSQVKWQLKAFINSREPEIAKRVAAVETLDHPTEPELLALARSFFARADRMSQH